jgi:hypothetical protein
MVNIAGVDIRLAPCARPRYQIGVAGGVDNHFGQNRVPAFLAFKDHTPHDAIFDDWRSAPSVQQQLHLGLLGHPQGQRLECFGIDRRRPRHNAMVSSCPLRPIGGGRGIAVSPIGAWRALNRILRQAFH